MAWVHAGGRVTPPLSVRTDGGAAFMPCAIMFGAGFGTGSAVTTSDPRVMTMAQFMALSPDNQIRCSPGCKPYNRPYEGNPRSRKSCQAAGPAGWTWCRWLYAQRRNSLGTAPFSPRKLPNKACQFGANATND